jgi:hypothetical protein
MRRTGVVFLAVASLAGCSVEGQGTIVDAPTVDAAPPEFGCSGVAWPTTAPDPLALNGRVLSPASASPIGDVTVAMQRISDDSPVGSTISTNGGAFAGTYSIAAATGGVALATYRKATSAGQVDAYAYDPFAVYNLTSGNLTVYSPTPAELDGYYTAGGVTNDPAKGTLQINVVDCSGVPLHDATVTVTGAARVLYLDDQGAVDMARTTTSKVGVAIVLGVTPGVVDVAIQDGTSTPGVAFRAWPVTSFANSYTSSLRYP